jgi:hypothetical protein
MKYLESFQDNDLIQFGLKIDDLKWYFTDIIDEGFNIRIIPMKKLYDFGKFDNLSIYRGHDYKLGLINYIHVKFSKIKTDESVNFLRSEEFKLIIEEADKRLLENQLFIGNISTGLNTLNLTIDIFIYRKSDEKYIK